MCGGGQQEKRKFEENQPKEKPEQNTTKDNDNKEKEEETVVENSNQAQVDEQVNQAEQDYNVQTLSEYIGEDVEVTNTDSELNENTYVSENPEDLEALLRN